MGSDMELSRFGRLYRRVALLVGMDWKGRSFSSGCQLYPWLTLVPCSGGGHHTIEPTRRAHDGLDDAQDAL